ncbi:MAG: CPBP family intramembrane metalloprotease [Planctomycetaceae bacterium]|nr:CPBP family intramembrane metalloprotease [Planctomycetaceae bacterium]
MDTKQTHNFWDSEFPQPEQHHTVFSAIVFEGGLAVLALVIGYFCSFSPTRTLSWSFRDVVLGFAAAIPMLVVFVFLDRATALPLQRIQQLVRSFLGTFFGKCSTVQIFLICVLAGIGEELFFRGLMQDGIAYGIGGSIGLICGIVISSLLFGAAHLVTLTYGVIAFLMSLYFAALFHWSGNILVPIITHALYDYCVIRFVLRRFLRTQFEPRL